MRSLVAVLASNITLMACQSGPPGAPPPSQGGPADQDETLGDPSPPVPTTGVDPSSSSSSSTTTTGATTTGADTETVVSTSELTSATTAPEGCGDGMLDQGENCDEGYAQNDDHSACTQSCQAAVCGDGFIWTGHEACDDGPGNNDSKWGGCTTSCELGPRCGDGAFQPDDEECDPSAPPVEGGVECDPDVCRFQARVAFVTSAEFGGNLGGLSGADAACVAAAKAAGLDNAPAFLAWISDGKASPTSRLIKGAKALGYPYARRDGKRLAYDLKDLTSNGLWVPLDLTEHGVKLPPEEYAWTNVDIHGEPHSATEHCQGWTSQSFKAMARAGQISPEPADLQSWQLNGRWTSYAVRLCKTQTKMHLYCFED